MTKERAEKGTAPMVESLTVVIGGTIHGLNGKPAVAGKTRVWTSAALWTENISFVTKTHYTPQKKHDTPHKKHYTPHSNYIQGGSDI